MYHSGCLSVIGKKVHKITPGFLNNNVLFHLKKYLPHRVGTFKLDHPIKKLKVNLPFSAFNAVTTQAHT